MPEQHIEALNLANTNRMRHARRRRAISNLDVPDALELAARTLEEPHGYEGLLSRRLITAIHRYGPARAETLIRRSGCRVDVRVGEMTGRQRDILAGLLRGEGAMVDKHGFARRVAA